VWIKRFRTEAIKTKKRRRVFFSVYLFKIGSIRCNTQVSTRFQLLHESCLAGRSRLSESLHLYQILYTSAATSPSGIGSSRRETNLKSMGAGSMLGLVLSQKLSNICCRMRRGFFVQKEKITIAVQGGTNSSNARN